MMRWKRRSRSIARAFWRCGPRRRAICGSGMRIASMLERASDCARNLAKRTPMARAMRSGRPKCAMMEDPRTITACMHLHFIARNIARVGDHATAIAEQVPGDPRPKMDSATGDAV